MFYWSLSQFLSQNWLLISYQTNVLRKSDKYIKNLVLSNFPLIILMVGNSLNSWRTVWSIMVNEKMASSVEEANKSGGMGRFMRGLLKMTWLIVKADWSIQAVTYMKEIGWMTRHKGKVCTTIRMGPHTRENGSMTNSMDMGQEKWGDGAEY